jgi:excisionase family DNA binding protein
VSFETQFGAEGESQVEKEGAPETPRGGQPTNVMTVREVSAYLHVHPTTIYRLLKKKKIPAFHIGSDWRFNIEDIDRWRLEQKEPGD